MDTRELLTLMLVGVAMIGLIAGAINRFQLKLGIGSQFIRYNTVVVVFPISAALASGGMLTEAAVSLLLGIVGFVFANKFAD